MRINSVSDGLFTNRMLVRSGIGATILMLCAAGAFGSVEVRSDRINDLENVPGAGGPGEREMRMKQVNLLIRLIGHQLLLQSGDSMSRVLPVTEVSEGTFTLQVEKQFNFSHDSLIALTQTFLPKWRFPAGYTVTVHDCLTASIVYGFQINNSSPDILGCTGRYEPLGCYLIEFAFTDLYKTPDVKKEDTRRIEKSTSKDVQTNTTPQLSATDTQTNLLARQLSLIKSPADDTRLNHQELKGPTEAYPIVSLVYTGMLISLGVTLVLARAGMFVAKHADIKAAPESLPTLTPLGKLHLDVKGQRLLSGREEITLTEKEYRILELLNNAFGELVTRETLMQKIWLDEGVITGRSLDMFVSKLRKKLSADPELKITNVHGKGYKLE